MEHLPDQLEAMEAAAEARLETRGDEYKCEGCGQWRHFDDAHPTSANPYCVHICTECAVREGVLPKD